MSDPVETIATPELHMSCDSVQVHHPDKGTRVFQADKDLVLPEILPDFSVIVRELFE